MADENFQIIRTPDGMTHRFPKEATPDEINEALGGPKDSGPSFIGKVQNLLATGNPSKSYNHDINDPSRQFSIPPWAERTGTALSLIDPIAGIAENPEGIINLGKSLYQGARAGLPKILGGAGLAAAGGGAEAATEGITHLPSYARYIATYPGIKMMGQGMKDAAQSFASKFDPASMSGLLSDTTDVAGRLPPGGPSPKWSGPVRPPEAPPSEGTTIGPLGKVDLPTGRKVPTPEERVSRAFNKPESVDVGKTVEKLEGTGEAPKVKSPKKPQEEEKPYISNWRGKINPYKKEGMRVDTPQSGPLSKVTSEKPSLNIENDFPEIQRQVRSGDIKPGDKLHDAYQDKVKSLQSDARLAKETRLANHIVANNIDLSNIPRTSEYLKALQKESGEKWDISLNTLEGAIKRAKALKARIP